MNLPELSIKRPVTTVMVVFIVVILGVLSFINLKQELMPEMDLGIAIVIATYDGAGPQEIESLISKPLEDALGTVSNLKNITSTSSSGRSLIMLEFADGTDMDNAALKMRENIDMVKRFLPDGVEPRVMQIDPNMLQSFMVGVTGDYDLTRLTAVLEDEIVGRFEKIDGVGSVSTSGGRTREISVELRQDKLVGYGVSAAQISGVIASENINMPGGSIEQGDMELQIRTTGEFTSISEIENLPLTTPAGAQIRLGDVARISDGFKKATSRATINGTRGVTLSISKQSTANVVDVSDKINAEIVRLREDYPDLDFVVILDTSRFIKSSLANVWQTIVLATILAVVVLLIFLGNFRASMIIGVAIPISLVASLALAYFTNLTLNMVTLNSLLIGVGMLVDNSIVVLENITRHLNRGKPPAIAARDGANEVAISIWGSSLTTIVVFVPVIFVEGIAGTMFGQLGLILVYSLMSSLVVSLTFVPMACSKFLSADANAAVAIPADATIVSPADAAVASQVDAAVASPRKKRSALYRAWTRWDVAYLKFQAGYGRVLRWALNHKAVVVAISLIMFGATALVMRFVGMEFMGAMDQGRLSVSVSAPRGSLIEETLAITDTVVERVGKIEWIKDITMTAGGGGLLSMGGGSNRASLFINLIPKKDRPPINEIAEQIRAVTGEVAGAEITVTGGDAMSAMMGGNTVSFSIFGDNLDELSDISFEVADLISTIPEIRNAESSVQEGAPQARIVIDRAKASLYGLQASSVASLVNLAVNGRTVSKYKVDGTEVDITLRYLPEKLNFITDLEGLIIQTPRGAGVPLGEVAEIVKEQGPASITKENHKRYVTISAEYVDTDLNSVTQEITRLLDDYAFPEGFTYKFGGAFENMIDSFKSLGLALVFGFILVYMVIASQFESLAYPATILFSIPIAWSVGLIGVYIFGASLSIVSIVGLILLMGIVVNNGIVLVDYINVRRGAGRPAYEAVLEAGPIRLRPILMTTITTVVGLVPMILSNSEGSEMLKPMGVVIAFGLSFSTLVTLVLIPTLYMSLHNLRKKLFRRA